MDGGAGVKHQKYFSQAVGRKLRTCEGEKGVWRLLLIIGVHGWGLGVMLLIEYEGEVGGWTWVVCRSLVDLS